MKTSSKSPVKHKHQPKTSFRAGMIILTVAVAGAILVAGTKAASIVTADALHPQNPAQTDPKDALFAMTVPSKPNENQLLEIKPTESAFMSVAMMNTGVPLAIWEEAGWKIGNVIGEADTVPPDCALHSRLGIAHQVYAACQGPLQVSIPPAGGDFVYVVFTASDKRVARVLRTGALYNPDTTGLIP